MTHPELINSLTLKEKCHLLSGFSFWQSLAIPSKGVPGVFLCDGPHGVRRQVEKSSHVGLGPSMPATCFPTAVAAADSWDPELCEEIGRAVGEEAAVQGVSVLLGPGLNIKRNPLCGRNFEYFSEDPYLAGKLAAGYVRGIQSNGISACLKHFAANNCELRRQASDSIVDERTLREIYLTGFEIAVREGRPGAIMSAYNRVNGVYCSENKQLLTDILRGEWGFEGFVVSDWGAVNSFVEGVRAGCELEMPSSGGDGPAALMRAVEEGSIDEAVINARVDKLLDVFLRTSEAVEDKAGKIFDIMAHHRLAERAAGESLVLLKNEDDILPLRHSARVAVIGEFASKPRYQGAGSSMVNPTRLDSVLSLIKDYPLEVVGFESGYRPSCPPDRELTAAAASLAQQAEVALLFLGLDDSCEAEGLDRSHIHLPENQLELLRAVAAVNKNIVVVLSAGSAVEMPWLPDVKGLIYAALSGQAGAGAALKALCGQLNPSGKLSETYPLSYSDSPSAPYFPARERSAEYREGLYVGYRYFDTAHKPVLFPFGFGLSYTSFEYSDPEFRDTQVSLTLKNTGPRDGAEVVQLYVGKESSAVYRPKKELKGFQKVFLKAGESKRVTIPLDDKAFRYYNTATSRFEVEGGEYTLYICSSSADVRLSGAVAVKGTDAPSCEDLNALPHYLASDITDVSDAEFSALLGRPVPDGKWSGSIDVNDSICQFYYAKSLKARLVYKLLKKAIDKSVKKGKPDLNLVFIFNMPIRSMCKISDGRISYRMCEAVVTIVNGHAISFFKGMGGLIEGFFAQRRVRRAAKRIR